MSKREGPRSSTIGATIEAPKAPRGKVPLGAVSLTEKKSNLDFKCSTSGVLVHSGHLFQFS